MADFYEILGISKNASEADIRRAYRKLAHEYHPDKTGGDEKKFRQVNEAYEVLSDANKRQQYDRFGSTFAGGASGSGPTGGDPFSDFARGFGFENASGFDFGDIFSDIFGGGFSSTRGGRGRGVDLELPLAISFSEAVFGVEKKVSFQKQDTCETCRGTGGEPGTKLDTCATCHGTGKIQNIQRTILGNIRSTVTCPKCQGRGKIPQKPCATCKGAGIHRQVKHVTVKVPAGIDDGQRIRLRGLGEAGYQGSTAGDLYVRITVEAHNTLKREGEEIISEIPVSFYQAALGTRVDVETVDGTVELKVSAGTQSGKVIRIRGKGVPALGSNKRGDHMVTIRVVTPTKLTKREKDLLRKMADEKGEIVDIEEGVWDKIKGQFGE